MNVHTKDLCIAVGAGDCFVIDVKTNAGLETVLLKWLFPIKHHLVHSSRWTQREDVVYKPVHSTVLQTFFATQQVHVTAMTNSSHELSIRFWLNITPNLGMNIVDGCKHNCSVCFWVWLSNSRHVNQSIVAVGWSFLQMPVWCFGSC